ncbi:ATP-binding protein [Trinickia sp. LjRoot230]|uniref:ATP-binding protein n=1 Tax=Trinickia sp. LjRoot230 TaxID=3342288 RepID=UPI003ECCD113
MNASLSSGGRVVRVRRAFLLGVCGALLIASTILAGCRNRHAEAQPPHISWDLHIPLSAEDRAYLDSLPVLRIGTDPGWAPMAFVQKETGEVGGISADYLGFIHQTLGVRFRVVPTHSWAETIQVANNGGLDVVVAASPLDGLNQAFQYSRPYVSYPLVVVTRETAPFIGGAEDISGSEIAIVKDSEMLRAQLPGMHNTHTMVVSSAEEGLDAVASGRAFAYIGNLGVVDRLVREKYTGILRVAAPAGHIEDLSFAISPQYARLLSLIDRVLAAIPESEREHIQNSWLSTRFTFGIAERTLWIVLTPVIAITLLFLTVLCIYMLRLRKEVRQRRSTEQQLVELTRALPAVVFQLRLVRGDGHAPFALVFVNRCAYDWLGVRADATREMFDRFLAALDGDARFGLTRRFLRSVRSRETVRAGFALSLGGARRAWANLEAAPQLRDGGDIVWTGYVYDVTQAQQIQTALVTAKHDAEEAARARDAFLATVSHEIRTPMSGVVGILQLLDHGRLPADDQHLLDMARNAAEILLRVLNDILDFAKSENGDLTLESAPMSVADLVDRTAGIVRPEIERKGLRFDVETSRELAPRYLGDAQRIGQVLLNLLGNATKFTDYGVVSLSVGVKAREAHGDINIERIVIAVSDTGIGIAGDDQARLFSPFVQARSHAVARPGGTGLGLVICKRLVESMGGVIALESEPGCGTTITIELPLPVDRDASVRRRGEGRSSAAESSNVSGASAPERQILLVEDQDINREVLKRQLATLRITECDTAANGAQALKLIERREYAMVITDCAMPVMDGVTLIKRVRAHERDAGAPRTVIVALTANAMVQQKEACLAAGANEVFVKPVSVEQLQKLLERHGITAPPIVELEKAGIPSDRHTDLWEKLRRTLAAELAALLSLPLEEDVARAREIVHRIVGAASWFHLNEVAQTAARLEACFESAEPPHAALFDLQAAIARATAEMTDSADG